MPERVITSGDITARIEVRAAGPGDVIISADLQRDEVSGPTGAIGFLQDQVATRYFNISYRPASISRASTIFNRATGDVAQATGLGTNRLVQLGAENAASDIQSSFNALDGEQFELLPGDTRTISKRVTFPTVKIPSFDSVSGADPQDVYNNLPTKPTVTVTVDSSNAVSRVLTSAISGEFRIPYDALVEEVSPSTNSCGSLYSEIQQQVNDVTDAAETGGGNVRSAIETVNNNYEEVRDAAEVRIEDASIQDLAGLGSNRIRTLRDRIRNVELENNINLPGRGEVSLESAISELQEQKDQVESDVGIPRCKNRFKSNLDDQISSLRQLQDGLDRARDRRQELQRILLGSGELPCQQRFPGVDSEVSGLEDRASNLSPDSISMGDVRDLISRKEEIQQRVRNDVDEPGCADEFRSRLDSAESSIRRVQSILEGEDPNIPDVPTGGLGCSDIPQDIRTEVSGFENQVSDFTGSSSSQLSPDRKQSLVSDGENILSTIDSRVSDNNPCKSQLRSRVERELSSVRQVDGVNIRQPCFEKYPELEERIDNYEVRIVRMSRPTEAEVGQVADDAEELISDIEEIASEDDRCVRRFSERVRSGLNRVESGGFFAGVTSNVEESEQEQETRSRIQNLNERLEGILSQSR